MLKYLVPKDSNGKEIPIEERNITAQKVEDQILDLIFYTSITVCGWYMCIDKDWMPWFLGGHGKVENAFVNISFSKVEAPILYYGLINFGWRVENFVN